MRQHFEGEHNDKIHFLFSLNMEVAGVGRLDGHPIEAVICGNLISANAATPNKISATDTSAALNDGAKA